MWFIMITHGEIHEQWLRILQSIAFLVKSPFLTPICQGCSGQSFITMKSTSIVVLLMIIEEEISHQNNNFFDLSHPTPLGSARAWCRAWRRAAGAARARCGWRGRAAASTTPRPASSAPPPPASAPPPRCCPASCSSVWADNIICHGCSLWTQSWIN